jgi:hypothetical protein
MKGESAAVTLQPDRLGRLTEVSRDRGLLLMGLGVLDGVLLALPLRHDAETWWAMPLLAAFFTAAYLFFDGAGRSLIRQVERRSEALDGEIAVGQHPALPSTPWDAANRCSGYCGDGPRLHSGERRSPH